MIPTAASEDLSRAPRTPERLSHGEAKWFVGERRFVTYADRHDDDRRAAWLAATSGAQERLVRGAPDRLFRPPYVGHRGWIGVYLDVLVNWAELETMVPDAWTTAANPCIRAKYSPPDS